MMRFVATAITAFWLAGPAMAQAIVEKAKEAETLAGQGKFIDAIIALDEAAAELWEKSPLTFRRALWVAEPPGGFGSYNPRESSVFAAGAQMIAYVEPVGFGWRQAGDIWRTELLADLVLKSADGKVLLEKKEFQKLQLGSRVRNREFMARFVYTFTGIPPGEYVAETVLRDAVTSKSGAFSLPFTVR